MGCPPRAEPGHRSPCGPAVGEVLERRDREDSCYRRFVIASDELHLFFADPDSVSDGDVLGRCRALLSEEERVRCDRFKFARDRHQFLVSHALVRTVVARYADADPASLRFEIGERGRPELLPGTTPRPVRFNLSHTDGLIAVGVTAEHDVGVDVERMREVNLGIADKHFAPSEVESMRALPDADQRARFFAYWTLKESYIKARGLGLALPLDGFAFDLDGGGLGFHIRDDLGDRGADWSFALLEVAPHHRAAFAVRQGSGGVCRWRVFEGAPFQTSRERRPATLAGLAVESVPGPSGEGNPGQAKSEEGSA